MVFANIVDQIFGYLCFGFIGLLVLIGFVLYSIGSAAESLFKNDKVQDVAKGVAEEVTKGAIVGFLENLFDD